MGEKFEQQGFDVNDEGELVSKPPEALDAKDQKEPNYIHFERLVPARTFDYVVGKSWLFTQDDILVLPVEEKKDKDGFALFRLVCNANPDKRGKGYENKQVELSKDKYSRYINVDKISLLKLIPEDGSKRRAKEYLEEHGKWFIDG